MQWYTSMTKQQKNDFKKIIIVSAIGAYLVVAVPLAFYCII